MLEEDVNVIGVVVDKGVVVVSSKSITGEVLLVVTVNVEDGSVDVKIVVATVNVLEGNEVVGFGGLLYSYNVAVSVLKVVVAELVDVMVVVEELDEELV